MKQMSLCSQEIGVFSVVKTTLSDEITLSCKIIKLCEYARQRHLTAHNDCEKSWQSVKY